MSNIVDFSGIGELNHNSMTLLMDI
uniref:Uncharacterized protein n=1 Tax=Rhizophora mucronata TaxID=61149 RepID=A0A2P2PGB0_RHIMU